MRTIISITAASALIATGILASLASAGASTETAAPTATAHQQGAEMAVPAKPRTEPAPACGRGSWPYLQSTCVAEAVESPQRRVRVISLDGRSDAAAILAATADARSPAPVVTLAKR